jgi:hypothetical protein
MRRRDPVTFSDWPSAMVPLTAAKSAPVDVAVVYASTATIQSRDGFGSAAPVYQSAALALTNPQHWRSETIVTTRATRGLDFRTKQMPNTTTSHNGTTMCGRSRHRTCDVAGSSSICEVNEALTATESVNFQMD